MGSVETCPDASPATDAVRSRFERQVPWQISRHSALHQAVWQFLAICSLIFGGWYLWWRWTESLNIAALWFSLPLVVAETLAYFGLILFTVNIWTDRAQPWVHIDPDVPNFSGQPVDRQPLFDAFAAAVAKG